MTVYSLTLPKTDTLFYPSIGHVWSDLDDAPSDASSDSVSTLPSDTAMASLTELTHLTLVGLGLTGAIPSSVFTLPRLTHLDVSGNALSGSIPPEVELSPNLRYLSLAHNKVKGVVPAGLLTSKNMDTLLLQVRVARFPNPGTV